MHENAFENAVREVVAILSRPQYDWKMAKVIPICKENGSKKIQILDRFLFLDRMLKYQNWTLSSIITVLY